MAKRLARLDYIIESRFTNGKGKEPNNPYHSGGLLASDINMSLLDYLQAP